MTKRRSKLGEIALATVVTAGVIGAGAFELGVTKRNRKMSNNYSETEVIEAPIDCTGYNSIAEDLVEKNPSLKRIPLWRISNEIQELNPDVETHRIQPRQELVVPDYSEPKYE